MLIYRMENQLGRGPFFRELLSWPMHEAMGFSKDDERPYHDGFMTPQREGFKMTSDHLCGCRSKRELVKWFPKLAREFLKTKGFTTKVYDVPDENIQIGRHQVVFISTTE